MNKKTEYPDIKPGANDIAAACWEEDTLCNYDIYYLTPWQGMNSSRILLLRKTDFYRTGVMEFIFSHAWNG